MSSEVVQLIEPDSGRIVYTGWLRRLKVFRARHYAGLYSTVQVSGRGQSVREGHFSLRWQRQRVPCSRRSSGWLIWTGLSGSAWGHSGFYRIVRSGTDGRRVRYVKTLHELFSCLRGREGVLRTEHTISFLSLTIIRLHYKMSPAPIN